MKLIYLPIITSTTLVTSSIFAAENPESNKHLFVLSGQSNMREPMISTFADTMKKALGEDKVIVTSFGQPSAPIAGWYRKWTPPEGAKAPDNIGQLYDKLMASVQRSIKGQKIESVTFVWMQGEADAEAGWESRYKESFFGIIEQLKADLNIQEINFVIGRINDYWVPSGGIVDGDKMRALQVKMAESSSRGAWVNTDDLNTGVNPWGSYEIDSGHFPNHGYRVLGKRFAREACKLVQPGAKLNETLFIETFPDDVHKIKSNLALQKSISGTKPDTTHSGGKLGVAALVDGKLGTLDPNDPTWLAFPPTEKNIGFIIDLGSPTDVSSVAINLLVNHGGAAHLPSKIDVSISENGSDYKHLLSGRSEVLSFDKRTLKLNLAKDFKPQTSFVFIEKQAFAVRYIKVEIVPDVASNSWVFLDEIMVNPVN